MIELDRVTKRYRGSEVPALCEVSLHIQPGDFCLLTGPSGAGKSTLIRMLCGAEVPCAGGIRLGGEDLVKLPARRWPALRRSMGVVFQDFRLLGEQSVFANVALALEVQGRPGPEVRARVGAALERVGLAHKSAQRLASLSGGEQQRAAFARALVPEPRLLLCDEPTGNLDEDTARAIVALLRDAHARGTTVLVATHDPSLFVGTRRRTIRLEQGRVVADATADASPAAPATTPDVAPAAAVEPAASPAAPVHAAAAAPAPAPAPAKTGKKRKLSVVK